MLRESLASSLVFDWKPNWFLSRKSFLCGESSFGISILHGLWHCFVHLIHIFHFSVLEFLEGQQWWFLNLHPEWSEPSVHGLDCITWYQSLNLKSNSKLYPSIRCSLSFSFLSFFEKWETVFHLILVCLCLIVSCVFLS